MKTQTINKGLELLDKLQEAKAEEREECAKIADRHDYDFDEQGIARSIAHNIRRR